MKPTTRQLRETMNPDTKALRRSFVIAVIYSLALAALFAASADRPAQPEGAVAIAPQGARAEADRKRVFDERRARLQAAHRPAAGAIAHDTH